MKLTRRDFIQTTLVAAPLAASATIPWRLNYVMSSAMYGTFKLADILPEVKKVGAQSIDIWPRVHANHREQIEEMGHDAFAALLKEHDVKLGISTCYKLGPFKLREEMKFVQKMVGGDGGMLVCGARWPKGVDRKDIKACAKAFAEQMKPEAAEAEKTGCIIAVENHANSLLHSPDSMKWFAEFTANHAHIGIAFAPHHLPQDAKLQGGLIEALGKSIVFFYAQQHGNGSKKTMPKEQELLQMPGRGPLDFAPLVAALKKTGYSGFTEIFMHPFPRGLPVLPTIPEVTAEINRSRAYLDQLEPAPLINS